MVYCQKCAKKIPEDSEYCEKCGAKQNKGSGVIKEFIESKEVKQVPSWFYITWMVLITLTTGFTLFSVDLNCAGTGGYLGCYVVVDSLCLLYGFFGGIVLLAKNYRETSPAPISKKRGEGGWRTWPIQISAYGIFIFIWALSSDWQTNLPVSIAMWFVITGLSLYALSSKK